VTFQDLTNPEERAALAQLPRPDGLHSPIHHQSLPVPSEPLPRDSYKASMSTSNTFPLPALAYLVFPKMSAAAVAAEVEEAEGVVQQSRLDRALALRLARHGRRAVHLGWQNRGMAVIRRMMVYESGEKDG
jgi:hypothetical protein